MEGLNLHKQARWSLHHTLRTPRVAELLGGSLAMPTGSKTDGAGGAKHHPLLLSALFSRLEARTGRKRPAYTLADTLVRLRSKRADRKGPGSRSNATDVSGAALIYPRRSSDLKELLQREACTGNGSSLFGQEAPGQRLSRARRAGTSHRVIVCLLFSKLQLLESRESVRSSVCIYKATKASRAWLRAEKPGTKDSDGKIIRACNGG